MLADLKFVPSLGKVKNFVFIKCFSQKSLLKTKTGPLDHVHTYQRGDLILKGHQKKSIA
jgi:hypothetical protein